MFEVREVRNENYLLHHIDVHNNDISCKIFPNLGGSIQEFIYKGVQIIDGISIDDDGIDDYFNTHKSALLFPFPNRVKDGNYSFNGKNYQLYLNEPQLNNSIHGLVFDKHFKIEKSNVTPNEAKISLSYTSDGLIKGYPFKFIFNIEYSIKIDGEIITTIEIQNIDKKKMPFGIGWHPYFTAQNLEHSTLSFDSNEHFIFSDRSIPENIVKSELPSKLIIGNRMFDDGFSLSKDHVKFDNPKYELNLKFGHNITPYLQIYTPSHRKNIAIEPMTCATDALNNKYGLLELEADKAFQWVITLEVDLHDEA